MGNLNIRFFRVNANERVVLAPWPFDGVNSLESTLRWRHLNGQIKGIQALGTFSRAVFAIAVSTDAVLTRGRNRGDSLKR